MSRGPRSEHVHRSGAAWTLRTTGIARLRAEALVDGLTLLAMAAIEGLQALEAPAGPDRVIGEVDASLGFSGWEVHDLALVLAVIEAVAPVDEATVRCHGLLYLATRAPVW